MAGYFLDDVPFLPSDAQSDNFLWQEGTPAYEEFKKIADHIAAPVDPSARALSRLSGRAITFAVYGKWGTGKSSAVNIIVGLSQQRVNEWHGQLVTCNYMSSRYQSEFKDERISVRQSLGRELLIALFTQAQPGEKLAFMQQLPSAYAAVIQDIAETNVGVPEELRMRLIFEKFISHAIKSSAFDSALDQHMHSHPDLRCIVIIDDLDRCDPDYVFQLLIQTQQWSGVIRNLFFLIAVDRNKLRAAIDLQNATTQRDFALEKYVQHFVTLPPFTLENAKRFLGFLLPADSALNQFITTNIDLIYYGIKVKTPRSLKRCINALTTPLLSLSSQSTDNDSARHRVWEWMLEYTWDIFFGLYQRELRTTGDVTPALDALFAICYRFVTTGGDSEVFDFDLKRHKRTTNKEWQELQDGDVIDFDLVRFLGTPSLNPHLSKDNQVEKQVETENAAESNPLSRKAAVIESNRNIDVINHLRESTIEAQLARTVTDSSKLLAIATDEYVRIEQNRSILTTADQRQVTSYLGDIAGYLSQLDQDNEAGTLFEYTFELEAEPRIFVNNVTRYITAVIAIEDLNRVPKAIEYFTLLREPQFAAHIDQNRIAMLQVRINILLAKTNPDQAGLGTGASDDLEVLRKMIGEIPGDMMAFVAATGQAQAMKDYAALREFSQIRLNTIPSNDLNGLYTTLRVLADGLAASSEHADEFEAMEIYRLFFKIMQCGEIGDMKRDSADIYFNYGMLLYKHDYDDVAGYFWYEAYRLNPTDPATKRSYTRYLGRANDVELARRVSQSLPIDRLVLYPSSKTMPANLMAPEADKWWLSFITVDYNCTASEYPQPDLPAGGTIISSGVSS